MPIAVQIGPKFVSFGINVLCPNLLLPNDVIALEGNCENEGNR